MQQSPKPLHWRDQAITHSEIISDALEVAKAWGARFAEWILFGCLVANLLELFPFFPDWLGMAVMIVQSITLDVAGFGLTSMGSAARRRGDSRAAKTASRMGWTLISLMVITVTLVTLPKLVPQTASIVHWAEIALILVRIVITVFYSHIVDNLRQAGMEHADEVAGLREEVTTLQTQVSTLRTQANTGQQTMDTLRTQLDTKQREVMTVQQQLESAHGQVDLMTAKAAHMEQQVSDLTSKMSDLRGQVQDRSQSHDEVTTGQHEVTSKRSQITSNRSHEVTSERSTGQASSKEVRPHEVTRSQGQVLPFVPRSQERRRKHDPREVKAWCEAHADLSQTEQAAQLGISDAANLRRLLRKARELEARGQVVSGE